jgi:hypothetical protein
MIIETQKLTTEDLILKVFELLAGHDLKKNILHPTRPALSSVPDFEKMYVDQKARGLELLKDPAYRYNTIHNLLVSIFAGINDWRVLPVTSLLGVLQNQYTYDRHFRSEPLLGAPLYEEKVHTILCQTVTLLETDISNVSESNISNVNDLKDTLFQYISFITSSGKEVSEQRHVFDEGLTPFGLVRELDESFKFYLKEAGYYHKEYFIGEALSRLSVWHLDGGHSGWQRRFVQYMKMYMVNEMELVAV